MNDLETDIENESDVQQAELEEGSFPELECALSIDGWVLSDGTNTVTFDGTASYRSYVLVSGGADQSSFEDYWDSVEADRFFTGNLDFFGELSLFDAEGALIDGPTYPIEEGTRAERRGNSPAARKNDWHIDDPSEADPGDGNFAGPHIRITEISDALAGDSSVFRFIEIYTGGHDEDCTPEQDTDTETEDGDGDSFDFCQTDADCVGHPDGPACHPFGHFCGVDISDWGVIQSNEPRSRYFATPTIVRSGSSVILAGTATQASFESWWGVTLGPDAVFVSTAGLFPAIDGGETYIVQAPGFITADGPTPSMIQGQVLTKGSSGWHTDAPSPGVSDCDSGVFLSEIADVSGAGYSEFEYVELCVKQ